MINYTIVMSSVNANLLEFNQAKSRINQAKKDGKEVNKMKFYECYLTLRKYFRLYLIGFQPFTTPFHNLSF